MPHLRDASPVTPRASAPDGAVLRWFPREPAKPAEAPERVTRPPADAPVLAPLAAPLAGLATAARAPFTAPPVAPILNVARSFDRFQVEEPAA
jgi:hypothetical protein